MSNKYKAAYLEVKEEIITAFVQGRFQTFLMICPFAGPFAEDKFIAGK